MNLRCVLIANYPRWCACSALASLSKVDPEIRQASIPLHRKNYVIEAKFYLINVSKKVCA